MIFFFHLIPLRMPFVSSRSKQKGYVSQVSRDRIAFEALTKKGIKGDTVHFFVAGGETPPTKVPTRTPLEREADQTKNSNLTRHTTSDRDTVPH